MRRRTTFEMDDLARLVIDRPAWGFSPTCEVDYFISRDAENPGMARGDPVRRQWMNVERETRIELATCTLEGSRSAN